MTEQPFSLLPFPAPSLPEVQITGGMACENGVLAIHYLLSGKLDGIHIPAVSTKPRRRDALWKSTCFELFLASRDLPPYWEFNFSPAGDWNVYRMEAYRRIGFREETSIQRLQVEARQEAGGFVLSATIDLNPVLEWDHPLDAGIAAIIKTKEGTESYWALAHPVAEADFHLRDSFTLVLAG